MSRLARQRSETSIYHIMLRGINRQSIFEDNKDKERFYDTLRRYKKICCYELYGYCFMDNHIHLLLKEISESISMIIKRISSSYVYWFNWKYERCGHLFQERFKSEAVDSEAYLLTVLRYIHQNPVKAGLTKSITGFKWSSFNEYISDPVIIDVDYVLDKYSLDRKEAIEAFKIFMNQRNDDRCLDYDEKVRLSDDQVREIIVQQGIKDINRLLQLDRGKSNELIKTI